MHFFEEFSDWPLESFFPGIVTPSVIVEVEVVNRTVKFSYVLSETGWLCTEKSKQTESKREIELHVST